MRANRRCGKSGFACHPWGSVGVTFEASPDLPRCAFLLRLQAQGTPSVAHPFDGVAIHWVDTFFRLTPVRAFAELPLSTGQRLPARPQAGSYGLIQGRAARGLSQSSPERNTIIFSICMSAMVWGMPPTPIPD